MRTTTVVLHSCASCPKVGLPPPLGPLHAVLSIFPSLATCGPRTGTGVTMSRTVMDLGLSGRRQRYLLPELAMLELLSMDARKTFVRRLLPVLGFAVAQPALAAEVDLLDLSIEELADLRVTSVSRVEERLADAPAAVFVITRDEHPPLRRHQHRRSAAPRARRRSRAAQRTRMVDHAPRLQQRPRQQAAGADRRAQRLLAAVRRRVLGRAGHAARGRRAHRGHRGPGGTLWGANAVNGVINIITRPAERHAGAFCRGRRRQRGTGLRGAALRRHVRRTASRARGYVKALDRDSLTERDRQRRRSTRRSSPRAASVSIGARATTDRLTLQGDFYQGDEAGVFQNDFTLGTLPSGSRADDDAAERRQRAHALGTELERRRRLLAAGLLRPDATRHPANVRRAPRHVRPRLPAPSAPRRRARPALGRRLPVDERRDRQYVVRDLHAGRAARRNGERVPPGQDRRQRRADVPDARLEIRAQRLLGLRDCNRARGSPGRSTSAERSGARYRARCGFRRASTPICA